MLKKTVGEFIEGHPWLCRLVRDKDFRTVLTAFSGLSLNILFAVFNGAVEKSFALVRDAGRVLYSPGRHAVWLAFSKRDAAQFPEKGEGTKIRAKALHPVRGFVLLYGGGPGRRGHSFDKS